MATPNPIDATTLYHAMVGLSRYNSKRLIAPAGTRSAAVTIILRFSHDNVPLDLSLLVGERGLMEDENLVNAGTHHLLQAILVSILNPINETFKNPSSAFSILYLF